MILGGTIITMDSMRRVIHDGGIVVEDDLIASVGAREEAKRQYGTGDIVIEARQKVILPGIVNVHTHVGGTPLIRGISEDRSPSGPFRGAAIQVEPYISPGDIYELSMLGCIEAAKFGSTTISEGPYHFMWETARAAKETGLRAIVTHKIIERTLEDFVSNRAEEFAPQEGKKRLKESIKMIEDWHGKENGRISCRIGPQGPDSCSPELLKRIKDASRKYSVGIHTHVGVDPFERSIMKKRYGKGSVEFLRDIGFLGPDVIAAHLACISPAEVEIVKQTDTHMAHCPLMISKRGYFPLMTDFYRAGVNVALGNDWTNLNPWENMRAAITFARVTAKTVTILSANKALEMATLCGAKALGMENQIGSIEKGKKADIILVNLNKAHLNPVHDIIQNLVYYCTGPDVETVIVDGRVIVENGMMKTAHEDQVIEKARKTAGRIWSKCDFPPVIN
jgi:5-methylthioadenosine/S-adenosylhomocysteine deaminase